MTVLSDSRPVTSLKQLCDCAAIHGIGTAECLSGTGIRPVDLEDADALHSTEQEIKAIENFARLAPRNVGLGWSVGQSTNVHAFGIWGFAILTSPTLRAAIEIAIEYSRLSFLIADMSLHTNQDQAALQYDLNGLPDITHRYILEKHLCIAVTFIRTVLQQPHYGEFIIHTPDACQNYVAEMTARTGIKFEGGHPAARLVFPQNILDLPLPDSDPVTFKFCLDQCNTLLDTTMGALPNWSQRVRDAIVEQIGTEQRIEDVAKRLMVTERTLRRRLTDEGTSFRDLYTEARMAIAWELLASAGLNVETVAWRVGYAEPAAFARAFAKTHGVTPGELRKRNAKASA